MKKVVAILIVFTLFFMILMGHFLSIQKFVFTQVTGNSVMGTVLLTILSDVPIITIDSPLNVTYTFGFATNFTLDLNVSANQNITSWSYSLEDAIHHNPIFSNVPFTPNITFFPIKKSNNLSVYATNSFGQTARKSVFFYVNAPDIAPVLGNISSQLYVCEGTALSYFFNASDPDYDDLVTSVSPNSPFFVSPSNFYGLTFIQSELFSGLLYKSDVGNYSRTISVYDGQYTDSKDTNITVIEINNIPTLLPIGVQTIYSSGVNTSFSKQVNVTDIESGDAASGNFSFNLTFLNGNRITDVSHYGMISIIGNSSVVGNYNLSLCVSDQALSTISPNINLCGQNGSNNTVCTNFSITITDQNRPPTIISYFPNILNFNASDLEELYFNVSTYDPDLTIPDIYWYVDGVLKEYTSGNSSDSFLTSFACETSGLHNVTVEITDGLLNDSVTWKINLHSISCPVSQPIPPSGGGGGGGNKCLEKWACDDWSTCQSTSISLKVGVIGQDDYRLVDDSCQKLKLVGSTCGMQTRNCNDVKMCNSTYTKPQLLQACKYTQNPSCSDGIQNCHNGACELLIDCGGPCAACPSCSDGIQNQGELGIDCGGPCPFKCSLESPLAKYYTFQMGWFVWLLWLLLLILLIILTRRLYLLFKEKKEFEKERKIQSIFAKQVR